MFFDYPFQFVAYLVGLGFSFSLLFDVVIRVVSVWKYFRFFRDGGLR